MVVRYSSSILSSLSCSTMRRALLRSFYLFIIGTTTTTTTFSQCFLLPTTTTTTTTTPILTLLPTRTMTRRPIIKGNDDSCRSAAAAAAKFTKKKYPFRNHNHHHHHNHDDDPQCHNKKKKKEKVDLRLLPLFDVTKTNNMLLSTTSSRRNMILQTIVTATTTAYIATTTTTYAFAATANNSDETNILFPNDASKNWSPRRTGTSTSAASTSTNSNNHNDNNSIIIDDDDNDDDRIVVPLEYQPDLNAYVLHYYLFGERFTAIVDSGSPFLTVPSTCKQWGCYRPELTFDSGYSNTIEGFDNSVGPVVWRKAEFAFESNNTTTRSSNDDHQSLLLPAVAVPKPTTTTTTTTKTLTFGVLGQDLLDGPGGVFFGLVKETDSWIRPSFLGQTGYNSFRVDLRHSSSSSSSSPSSSSSSPQLILSKRSLIHDDEDYVPLVRDLHNRFKDPVVHYTAMPTSFVVNGLELKLDPKTPTYVIFDTGLTGMAVSEKLFDGRNLQARKNREKSLWGQVRVSFETHAGNSIELSAVKPITTPLLGKDSPWTRVKGNLIVLGLAFLDGFAITIDVEDGKLQLVK